MDKQEYAENLEVLSKDINELRFVIKTLENNLEIEKKVNAEVVMEKNLLANKIKPYWAEIQQWRKFREVVQTYRDMSYEMRELFLKIVDMEKELENERKHNEED